MSSEFKLFPEEFDPFGRGAHEPGSKLDATKPNCDLVFSGFNRALLEVARVGTYGATKYTENGWKDVPNGIQRYRSAIYRHMLSNEYVDPESRMFHMAQVAWNALAVLELMMCEAEDPTI